MFAGNLPTGTVSADHRESPADGSREAPERVERTNHAARVEELERRNEQLREELARRKQERQDIIERYERLLARRDRRLGNGESADDESLRERAVAALGR